MSSEATGMDVDQATERGPPSGAAATEYTLSKSIFGRRNPFKQFSPNLFVPGGVGSLFGRSFEQKAEAEDLQGSAPAASATKHTSGRYSFQLALRWAVTDAEGKPHSQRFVSSDVGHFGHGGLRETHQAFSDHATSVECRALEQHVGNRALKWVKQRDYHGHEITKHLCAGMDESGKEAFERDLSMNCHHLPSHVGFHGGILAGFGDHHFAPFEGVADWHTEPLPSPAPIGGPEFMECQTEMTPAAEMESKQAELPPFSESLFGTHDPFQQFCPNPFLPGGLQNVFSHAFGQVTDNEAESIQASGRYSFQLAIMSTITDANGKANSENFSSSDVGHFGHGGLRESHQAYSNSASGVEKRALEQHVGERARKWIKECSADGVVKSKHIFSGMEDGDNADFEHRLNLNCHHLPAHAGFHGGVLAGFGDHVFKPFDGAADWHKEPLTVTPSPLSGHKGGA